MGLVKSGAVALMCGVAFSAVALQGAAAQSAKPTNVNTTNVTLLERLVIGAGAPKVAINTPQAVTVINQADIDNKQVTSTGEIFNDVPGITAIGSERVLGESFNIRGIGAAETSGDESRIIITVDGAKKFYEQYRMGSFFSDPELYKRVEVLRGPASSTLYGAGALGGVINFTTKDASDFIAEGMTGAVRVKGAYNSNGNGTLTSAILAHRINETFEILATGNFRRSDVMTLASGGNLPGSAFQAWSGLIKGTMHLDDEQVVRLSYQKWNSDADNQEYAQTGTVALPLNNPQNFGLVDRTVDDQTAVLSYENPVEANDMLDLKMQLSYSNTAVSQTNATYPFPGSNFLAADYGYQTYQANAQNTSTFRGDGWENFLTYGVQASHQIRTAKPVAGNTITTHPEGNSSAIGVFAQTEHTINDRFTVIAGARGDYAHLAPSSTVPGGVLTDQFAFSPKLAALYQFNDSFNVFGSVAHTERLPTLDETYQYEPVAQPLRGSPSRTSSFGLGKERSDNYEIGFATQGYDIAGLDNSVGFKATAFYNDIKDGIRVNPTLVNGLPYYLNIGGMRFWGVELEGSYESDMFFARLAYTLTRGEYTQNVSATVRSGMPVESLPQDKLVATLGARIPEQDLEFGVRGTLASDPIVAVATSPATAKPDAWGTVDLFANWKPQQGQFKGLELSAGIDNLFNADYRENLSMDRSKGRTFKLTLSKQFDY